MYDELSPSRRTALLEGLADNGWARATEVATARACASLLRKASRAAWSRLDGEGFSLEIAPLDDAALAAALGASDLRLVRHGVGDHGLPPVVEGRIGFVLDLNAGWPSQHGGLLIFADGDRVRGWRPEPGALTLFDTARPPILSGVSPGARAPRLAVMGSLREG